MGCGCKRNKNGKTKVEGESSSRLGQEQKDYRIRVNEAIKQFADLKKRKSKMSNY
jgi:hypothetical protein